MSASPHWFTSVCHTLSNFFFNISPFYTLDSECFHLFVSLLYFHALVYWTAVCFVTEINHNRVCMCKPEPPVNTSTVCQFRQFLTPAKWRSYLRIQTVLVRLYLQYTWIIELEFEQVKSARTASTVFNLSVGASLVILRTVFFFVYQWCSMTFS